MAAPGEVNLLAGVCDGLTVFAVPGASHPQTGAAFRRFRKVIGLKREIERAPEQI